MTNTKREVIEYLKNTSEAINAIAKHVYNVATISGFHENDGEIEDLKNGRFGDFTSNFHGEVSDGKHIEKANYTNNVISQLRLLVLKKKLVTL